MEYGFFGWILVGLIAGVLAKWVMPGRDPGGLLATILIGIAGGVVGGYLATQAGLAGGHLWNIIVATGGAALLLYIYRLLRR